MYTGGVRPLLFYMTGKLDPEERVLDTLLIQELESGPTEVGPGHLTQGYGFFGKNMETSTTTTLIQNDQT